MRTSRSLLRAALVLALAAETGCVPLPPPEPGQGPAYGAGMFQKLDPGAKKLPSLHFEVHAYDSEKARQVSEIAERLYNRIVTDTGIYSFRPERLYPIVIYGSDQEFFRKTNIPPTLVSGLADRDGVIYSREGAPLPNVIAHELTHIVFNEYMRRLEPVWVNEGLAVYEEQEASSEPISYFAGGKPIAFEQMILLDARRLSNLSAERGYRLTGLAHRDAAMSAWYHQVGSVVRFMIEKGGRQDFSAFLRALRDGRRIDEAIRLGFRGRWNGLAGLEAAWRGRR